MKKDLWMAWCLFPICGLRAGEVAFNWLIISAGINYKGMHNIVTLDFRNNMLYLYTL